MNMTHIPESIAKQPIDSNEDCSVMGNKALELVKKVFSEIEYEKLLDGPEWELNVIRAYKDGRINIDKDKVIKSLLEEREKGVTGEVIIYLRR